MNSRLGMLFLAIVLFGCAILFLTSAQKAQQHRYEIMEYPLLIIRLDTETGDLIIINLEKDLVDGTNVPKNIVKIDCDKATYTKELCTKQ